MKKILLLFTIFYLSHSLVAQENSVFIHRALGIELQYPNYWKMYSFSDKYRDLDYNSLSQEEIHEMIRLSAISPIFFIRKYEEVYYGINPSIRINVYRIPDYLYLHDAVIKDIFIDIFIDDFINYILSLSRKNSDNYIIDETINIDNVEVIYRKIFDYAVYGDTNYDERFERYTEYYIIKRYEYGFFIIIEMTYGKNNIDDQEEIQKIIDTIRILGN
jgi:hypothetical protein